MIPFVNPYRFGKKLAVYDPIGVESSAAVETGFEWAPLDSGHAILVYAKSGTYYAVCITLSGTTPSRGTAVSLGTAIAHYSVTRMDDTHAMFVWRDTSNNYGKACCLTLNGDDTITVESAYTFSTNNCRTTAVLGMDSGHAICGFKDATDGNKPKALCLTLSGTTVGGGSILTLSSSSIGAFGHGNNPQMDATHAIFGFNINSADQYVVGIEVDTGTDTLTAGTPALVQAATPGYPNTSGDCCGIDSTNALFALRMDAASAGNRIGKACGIVLNLSDHSISVGSMITFNADYTSNIDICTIVDSIVILVALMGPASGDPPAYLFDGLDLFHSASGPTVTAPYPRLRNVAPTSSAALAKWYGSTSHMLLAYSDTGDSNYGKIRCMTYLP